MKDVKPPTDELATLRDRSTKPLRSALLDLARARANFNGREAERVMRRIGDMLADAEALADLLGRRRLILEVEGRGGLKYAADLVVPNVTFTEAVRDILARTPLLARGYKRVQQVYSRHHGFALARSIDLNLTKRIQKSVADSISRGLSVPKASEILKGIMLDHRDGIRKKFSGSLEDWAGHYAQTVYRTNLATAYSAGRIQQAFDPDLDEFVAGFRFTAVLDVDTRKNHRAADGFVAHKRDPIWHRATPPWGYSCRCSTEHVTADELRSMRILKKDGGFVARRLPAGAKPDPGFGIVRPDLALYAGG